MVDRLVEGLKQLNLVDFLSQHYGLEFVRRGAAFACSSPFSSETRPSFMVRLVDGHWLFKDFSSDRGGTIFDFVQAKEKLGGFAETLAFLRRLVPTASLRDGTVTMSGGEKRSDTGPSYDVNSLYEKFRQEDPAVCRQYLLGRKISPDLIEELIRGGTVVHNRHEGRSYVSFAVRDEAGRLGCLDNHAIDGDGKFVLGKKRPFSLDWAELRRAKRVFVTEGIIDYLSVKTLEREPSPGLALLGNKLNFEPSLLGKAEVLVAALDSDRSGKSAVLDLQDMYPTKQVRMYDLEGHKDPNDLLVAVRTGGRRTLSAERKLQLYREFQRSENKAELAKEWGIDRSHLYEIVRDCEQTLVESFASRKPGRRPKGVPATLEEALERIRELEAEYEEEATRREDLYCRSEFLALRLKWAEIEAAEARGEKVEEGQRPKKAQVKKKRKKKRSRR